ncbi:PH domain-containing protein [Streptomyces sp.]|uniref:PH domain-containing protein n=1 Tax=Streptomyces sp. TaxID=1931 RepID=UPI002F958837
MADEQLRPDVQAAADRMDSKFGARREIRRLAGHLWDDETVHHLAGGFYGGGLGLVALTSRRLLFIREGWTGRATEDFPLDKLSSVQWNSGLVQGTLAVFASGNKAEIKQIAKVDGARIADAIRNRQAMPATQATAPQSPQQGLGLVDELTRLWGLVQQGALTHAEFEAAKARLLGPSNGWATSPGRAQDAPPLPPECR